MTHPFIGDRIKAGTQGVFLVGLMQRQRDGVVALNPCSGLPDLVC
jgi:hypothetical protein